MWSESWFSLNPGQRDKEIETEAAIRAAEAVRAIPTLKLSDRKHLAKLIKEARIVRVVEGEILRIQKK